jgi:hypothetical protein
MSMRKSIDTIGNRACDLPACSAVPQPTAPLRAPPFPPEKPAVAKMLHYSPTCYETPPASVCKVNMDTVLPLSLCLSRLFNSSFQNSCEFNVHYNPIMFRERSCCSFLFAIEPRQADIGGYGGVYFGSGRINICSLCFGLFHPRGKSTVEAGIL